MNLNAIWNHAGEKRVIAVTTTIHHGDIQRLCPGEKPELGNSRFLLNPPRGTQCDYWIIWAGSRDSDFMHVAPENTLFIAGEPPSKKIYPRAFYAQFHRVVSTHADDPHPRVTSSAPGLNWHVGLDRESNRYLYGYDELSTLKPGDKTRKISVVCSNLTTTEGQRKRLAFLDRLKQEIGEQVVHYGRGFQAIGDKMDAILPHRFHLVLENSSSPDYWTEKMSDAYLGWAFPIYAGCPNIGDYFPASGFLAIDLDAPRQSIATIRGLLETRRDEAEIQAIDECRRMVLHKYNPFARFAHWADMFYQGNLPFSAVRITSHKAFRPFPRSLIYRLKANKED